MRIFKQFNQASKVNCPICHTMDNKETVLIADHTTEIYNADMNSNVIEAIQVHLDCIELLLADNSPNHLVIYQIFKKKEI